MSDRLRRSRPDHALQVGEGGNATSSLARESDINDADEALVDLLRPLARVLIKQARAEIMIDAKGLDKAA